MKYKILYQYMYIFKIPIKCFISLVLWTQTVGLIIELFKTFIVFYIHFKEKKGKDQGNCFSREDTRKDIKKEKLIDKLTRRKWSNYRVS